MPPSAGIDIRLLGPVAVDRGGVPLRLGGAKQRAVLALLASRPGTVVSRDLLVYALWGDEPPRTAATALHGHVSRLRHLLGADLIATRPPGYALDVDRDDVDASRFERLVEEARGLPPREQTESLRAALGLWRGSALADLSADAAPLHEEAERLEELRLTAREQLFDARLALAQHAEVVPELETFVRAEPLRGRAVGQLMLALYRSGRQADALDAYRRFRRELNASLGLEPDQSLRDLERRILAQDPALAPPATDARPGSPRRLPLSVAAVRLGPQEDADLDAEVYAQTTARAREAVRLVFERHGGVIERAGSAVVGLFGAAAPNEDDPARAVEACTAALAAIEDLRAEGSVPARMDARAGVATGESFGGESPAIERALRLGAEAAPGEMRVDEATRQRARPRELRLDLPLAGRETEQRRLHELFDGAVRGRRSALVTLVGPAGIGKSRLAEQLAAAVAPAANVLRTRCLSYGDGVGLLPAAELVRGAAGLAADAAPDTARTRLEELLVGADRTAAAVDALLGVLGLADDIEEAEAGWAVRRLLATLAERSPVLAIVEDLHWAAGSFLQVVEALAEPSAAPVLVVATAREAPRERLAAETIDLAPLAPPACAEIVTRLLGGEVEERSLNLLVERSGGNPLFLEELVLHLRASGRLRLEHAWRLDDAGETPPPSVQSLLASHLERLPDRERDLLARCSVLGRSFTLAAVAELADESDDALPGLVAKGLLQRAPGADDLEFRHALIRDAAYASLPLGLRAELHDRAAARLDRAGDTGPREREALVVHHLDQAFRARAALTPDDPALASAATDVAARAASLGRTLLARGDAAAASALLARALELDARSPRAPVELGRARLDAGDLAGADAAFALAESGPFAHRARLGRLEVRLHTDPDCDLETAGREIGELLGELRRRRDDDGTCEALLASAYVSLTRGRIGELGATLDEALALAHDSGRSRAEAEILFLVCAASWFGPLPVADGIRRCENVLSEARERPNVEAAALQALAVLRAMRGDYDDARELVAAARSIRRDIGQEVGAAASAIDAGIVELLAGDHAAAERIFRSGYEALDRLGEKGYFSTLAGLLAAAVEAQGRTKEARDLARAAAAAAAPADVASQVGWRVTEARALARAGAGADAERVAREAVEIADATDFLLLRGDAWASLADVAAAGGDEPAAATARAAAVGVLQRKGLAPPAVAAWAGVDAASLAPAAEPRTGSRTRA